jgi:replicative DNA helicase
MPNLTHHELAQELIGACVVHEHEHEAVADILFRVPDGVFHHHTHQVIWRVMREMALEDIPTERQLVRHRLDDQAAITELDQCWIHAGYTHYANHFAAELTRSFMLEQTFHNIPELPADA